MNMFTRFFEHEQIKMLRLLRVYMVENEKQLMEDIIIEVKKLYATTAYSYSYYVDGIINDLQGGVHPNEILEKLRRQ